MLFAQTVFGYDVQESVVFIIRIIATIGSGLVGWFVCDPLTRVIYRVSFRVPTPTAWLFVGKSFGALILGAAVWILMPDGGGGGGPGFGPGSGGIPGKGEGKGGDKTDTPAKDAKIDTKKDKTETKDKAAEKLEPVEIEIISAGLYEKIKTADKEPWYVISKKAYTLDELDAYLKANHGKIEVTPVLTKQSIQFGREELTQRTKKYNVKTLQYVTR